MKIIHNRRFSIRAAVDTGLDYWYFTRHGIGPGAIPRDVKVLDWYEEGYKTWIKLDKMLTTAELNEYDLKELTPPTGSVTHNGDVIEACDSVTASAWKDGNFKRCSSDSNVECDEGQCEDIEGMSLINYKNYKIVPDSLFGGWKIIDEERDVIKKGLESEFDAKEYIDSITSSTEIGCAINVDNIDLDALNNAITDGCLDYLCGPEGGFKRPGESRESRWDMYADDIFNVDVNRSSDRIRIEVRAELDYSGMSNMADILDPIVKEYDPDAYFEQVEPGIMECYLDNNSIKGSEDIGASRFDRINQDIVDRHSDRVDPPDNDPVPDVEDEVLDFDFGIVVSSTDVDCKVIEGDPFYHVDTDTTDMIAQTDDLLMQDFLDILVWHLPAGSGEYAVKGKAHLVYNYDYYSQNYFFDATSSYINNLEIVSKGKVSSSTEINAAMSEDELDDAILQGKPFDIASYKAWKEELDPDAITAEKVEVDDVINVDLDASEVNLGTVVEIIAINDPKENWIDYTFRCKVVEDPGGQAIEKGSIIDLHFDAEEPVGHLVVI